MFKTKRRKVTFYEIKELERNNPSEVVVIYEYHHKDRTKNKIPYKR